MIITGGPMSNYEDRIIELRRQLANDLGIPSYFLYYCCELSDTKDKFLPFPITWDEHKIEEEFKLERMKLTALKMETPLIADVLRREDVLPIGTFDSSNSIVNQTVSIDNNLLKSVVDKMQKIEEKSIKEVLFERYPNEANLIDIINNMSEEELSEFDVEDLGELMEDVSEVQLTNSINVSDFIKVNPDQLMKIKKQQEADIIDMVKRSFPPELHSEEFLNDMRDVINDNSATIFKIEADTPKHPNMLEAKLKTIKELTLDITTGKRIVDLLKKHFNQEISVKTIKSIESSIDSTLEQLTKLERSYSQLKREKQKNKRK